MGDVNGIPDSGDRGNRARDARRPAGKDIGYQIGYQLGPGLVFGIVGLVFPAALILLLGGVYYVTARKDGVTFREAIFNWPLVFLAGIVAFLSLI